MADIQKIIDNLNLPKQILDKSEALLKALFGQSFDEIGGMISDQVRLRRFKNQINIFTKAQQILKDKKIDPKRVSLKVLAPLIEYSSYEEEETIQDKWSNLIAYVLENNSDITFQQNCITILNKISTEEAVFLDNLFTRLEKRRQAYYETNSQKVIEFDEGPVNKTAQDYPLHYFTFNVGEKLDIPKKKIEFIVSNLITLGLLKWETDVDIEATKSSEDPGDTSIDVEVNIDNNYYYIFSPLGVKFVEVCRQE